MAELLIKAIERWDNNADTSKMSEVELRGFNARSRKGDIVVVRPDGWKWGKCECSPSFIIVKLPNVKVEDVKHYEEGIFDFSDSTNPKMLKAHKYAVDIATVEDCAKEVGGAKELAKAVFNTKLVTKEATSGDRT